MRKILKYFFVFILFGIKSVYAAPANDSFLDDNLYKCVIDAYNVNAVDKVDYTYSILPEELIAITNLDCSSYKGQISDTTGLNKMTGLTSLNLSGNMFLGGQLKLNNNNSTLRSLIKLPSNLKITDITYKIDNPKIIKIENGVVYPLTVGSTNVTMTGKVSGNEITEKYSVVVEGEPYIKSDNSKLASLYLSKGEFKFDSDVKIYTTIVDESVDNVTISATVLDKKAKFVSGYGPRKVNLKKGTNTLLVKVQAENGNISTYTISVIRSDGNDMNNRLASLTLSVGSIDFSPDVYIYNLTVDSNINYIDIRAIAESPLSSVEISDTNLRVGENKITISVISESGEKNDYQLIVTRENYDSSDNYLSGLSINGYNINFKRDIFEYELKIKNEKILEINATAEKKESTISILGNHDLKDKSEIIVRVFDKEGSPRDYVINIKKDSAFSLSFIKNIDFKWIFLLLEFIVIIVLLFIIIFKNKLRKPRRPKKIKRIPKNVISKHPKVKLSNRICSKCGTVNDLNSKYCYVCKNPLQ